MVWMQNSKIPQGAYLSNSKGLIIPYKYGYLPPFFCQKTFSKASKGNIYKQHRLYARQRQYIIILSACSCGQNKDVNNKLSLYSTRTQNTWRRGLALGNAPDARFLRYPTQNIPTFWYILALPPTPIPDANPKICVTPDANPRRQSVEYSWRWVPTQNAGVGHVYFIFLV